VHRAAARGVWARGAARWAGAALLLASSAAWTGGGKIVDGDQARQWLQRMHEAATQRNYQGTLVVSANGAMSSSRLTHYCEGKQSFERVVMLDGAPQQVLRHNEHLLTLWPDRKVAQLEQRDAAQPFPALLSGSKDELFERYDLVDEGAGRVAGLEAAVFVLRPRDDARFAQRLWAERASGLLLRADVLAADGRVLETSAFSDVTIGNSSKPPTVQAALKKLEGWSVQRPTSQRTSLDAEGWQLKQPISGFRQSNCIKRQLAASGTDKAAPPEVIQATFTDGLTHVSLFIEPLRPDQHRPGSAVAGATHSWMQAHGAHWVTVIGDVPPATLKQFAAALERKTR
jgi:sigma-E factor negative regulatory protein RseB